MNTLIGFTVNQFFGQVRTSSPRVEVLPWNNLSLMLRSKAVQIIKENADFGGIDPHSISPPIPRHRQLEYQCGGSTPEV
jgi:hypothetical protein